MAAPGAGGLTVTRAAAPGADRRGSGTDRRGAARDRSGGRGSEAGTGPDLEWLLTLVPTLPVLLLLLRLWYLSRQDLQTMLLLVQNVSPLGLVSMLLITLVWTLPLVVLVGRALGLLFAVSTTGDEAPSGLVRAGLRVPNWVVALSVLLAALTWQLRFLPVLLMVTLSVLGLEVRRRGGTHPAVVRLVCVGLPLVVAVLVETWLGPAILAAARERQPLTMVLLAVPPVLAVLLTGPVPARAARPVTSAVAVIAVLLAPFLVGATFLRAPVLPTVAVEIGPGPTGATRPPQVVIGYVIAVNDRMTTLLDRQGSVRFVLNEQLRSETVCPDGGGLPSIPVDLHGWQVEQPVLAWVAPPRRTTQPDPRCEGRPLGP